MTTQANPPEYESLPVLYQRWAQEMLPGGIPRESVATCMDCVMCSEHVTTGDDEDFFNPASKCCTFFPHLPNFLAGRALQVDTPGAEQLRAFAAEDNTKTEVTLWGITPTIEFSKKYSRHGEKSFGHDASLLCPYAIEADTPEGPLCGIWQHRNAVCSTFFCKHVRGATGHRFWQAIRNLLMSTEEALAWWCITELIPDAAVVLKPAGSDTYRHGLELRDNAWAHWSGTRLEFYAACAEKVEALSWAEAEAIAGAQSRFHRMETETRYEALVSPAFPRQLRAAKFKKHKSDGARATIESGEYREFLTVPEVLLGLIPHFDGRDLAEVLADIEAKEGIELDEGLVRKLYDFGILEAS